LKSLIQQVRGDRLRDLGVEARTLDLLRGSV